MRSYPVAAPDRARVRPLARPIARLAGLGLALALVGAAQAAAPRPYVLDDTEVVATPSARLNRSYELYVSLPADYAQSGRRYPVVYVTDAPYAFPLVRAIAGRVDRHGVGLEPFILVGLGYATGESGVASRNRDYTPTDRPATRAYPAPVPGAYGHGAAYLDFLQREVLPAVDARYRTDPARRIYVGHSYGGLLGVQALLERPGLFSHFVIGSPSLWFARGHAFDALARHARSGAGVAGKVRFYVGGLERPTRADPDQADMVGQLQRYVAALRAPGWRGLDVKATVLDGEDHATVFPRLVTQGLMWALPRVDRMATSSPRGSSSR